MKNLLLLSSIVVLFTSIGCQQESPEPQENLLTGNYLATTEGSWWAYALYKYDYDGNVTFWHRDTLRALGDTIINGDTFTEYEGSIHYGFSSPTPRFRLRDSANYLINDRSDIILPYLNYTDTFSLGTPYRYRNLIESAELVETTVGTFESIDYRVIFDNPGLTPCGTDYNVFHQQFAEGIGLVRATYWYTATYGCGAYIERILESYHIAQ